MVLRCQLASQELDGVLFLVGGQRFGMQMPLLKVLVLSTQFHLADMTETTPPEQLSNRQNITSVQCRYLGRVAVPASHLGIDAACCLVGRSVGLVDGYERRAAG